MTPFDSYGDTILTFEGEPTSRPDSTIAWGQNRYLLWIKTSATGHTGQRKTYASLSAAKRRARKLRSRGIGSSISDRKIRPGTSGFLAHIHPGSGVSYFMDKDGVLHVGKVARMQDMYAREKGWRQ